MLSQCYPRNVQSDKNSLDSSPIGALLVLNPTQCSAGLAYLKPPSPPARTQKVVVPQRYLVPSRNPRQDTNTKHSSPKPKTAYQRQFRVVTAETSRHCHGLIQSFFYCCDVVKRALIAFAGISGAASIFSVSLGSSADQSLSAFSTRLRPPATSPLLPIQT